MNLFGMLDLSGSALTAERQRAEIATANMANAETTKTEEGGPYVRQLALFRAIRNRGFGNALHDAMAPYSRGVRVAAIVSDNTTPVRRYEPGHPDADSQGYVSFPAINPVEEMTDLMSAVRAYQMNIAAVQSSKNMIQQSLDILR
ncbi:MAG: flagellar basal body rod protein FlgC [Acidobacteriia bacterium]|nr:flagellar basal body rod protein FlgC [Terriglobia bacterium]